MKRVVTTGGESRSYPGAVRTRVGALRVERECLLVPARPGGGQAPSAILKGPQRVPN